MTNYKLPRFLSNAAVGAFATVAAAAALNGLIKARHDRTADIAIAKATSPIPGVDVNIDLHDILTAGGFLAAGAILLSLISGISNLFIVFPFLMPSHSSFSEHHGTNNVSPGARSFVLGWWIFAWLWTLVSAVIVLDFGRNREAKVTASANGFNFPDSIIQQLEDANHTPPQYWVHGYTRFLAISPWPLLFFTFTSTLLVFLAYRRSPYNPTGAAGVSGAGAGGYAGREKTSPGTDRGSVTTKPETEERIEDNGRQV